jgi:hypothetical protein
MIYLKEGEEKFVSQELIPLLSLTASAEEIRARARGLAAAGVDNLALQAMPGLGADLIDEFGREVIAKL